MVRGSEDVEPELTPYGQRRNTLYHQLLTSVRIFHASSNRMRDRDAVLASMLACKVNTPRLV
jgi:hypothetical protein